MARAIAFHQCRRGSNTRPRILCGLSLLLILVLASFISFTTPVAISLKLFIYYRHCRTHIVYVIFIAPSCIVILSIEML